MERSDRIVRAVGAWFFMILLAVAAAAVTIALVNKYQYGPETDVREYFQALQDGDGGKALGLLNAQVPDSNPALLDGDALAEALGDLGVPLILAVFLVALALRVAQGSATVALTTAAALMAPAVAAADLTGVQLSAVVLATAAGSVAASHVNDSGFWLVGRLMGMDPATTVRTWAVNQTLIAVIGFGCAVAVYLIGGHLV